MNGRHFLDTNVVIYAFSDDDPRKKRAETLLAEGGVLSIQVLNEFVAVARRKLEKNWKEVSKALAILRVFCPSPAPITIETHDAALQIARRHGYHIYDSLIIATAVQTSCDMLYSEDLRDGQAIGRLTIRNPFRAL